MTMQATTPRISVLAVTAEDQERLSRFFALNNVPAVTETFTPFPLTAESAASIAHSAGRDRYYLAEQDGRIVGFCMLRGWDEGYDVPSFGVFVDHEWHGRGIGRRLAEFAICECVRLGCAKLRLTVYESNVRALGLYASLGFQESRRDPVERCGRPDAKLTMIRELRDVS